MWDSFDDTPPLGKSATLRMGGLLVLLALTGLPFYVYHQVRLDAEQRQAAIASTGGNPDNGPDLIRHYGCGGCHSVPDVPGATGMVGPELGNLARRVYVGGVLTNTPDNLIAFIIDPKAIDEKSAMPRTGISQEEARDVATYLYSLR